MMEIQKRQENQNQSDPLGIFYGQICRNFKVKTDKELFFDLKAVLSKFNKTDFDYTFDALLKTNKGFSPTTGEIYQLCEESRAERRKEERSEKGQILIDYEKSVPLSKIEASKVWQNALKIVEESKTDSNTHVEEKKDDKRFNKILYEYYSGERLEKVVCDDHVDELLFKRACESKFYKTPHGIKKLYEKRQIVDGFFSTAFCEKSNFAKKITVGYF